MVRDPTSGKALDVMLIKVEIEWGNYSKNVYYKMQLLFEKRLQLYILFTNWGRIGAYGQHQQTPFFKIDLAMAEFKKIFRQKTKNQWDNIEGFEKQKRKYNLFKKNPRPKLSQILKPFAYQNPGYPKSKLSPDFQTLMRELTNEKMYQIAYSKMDISKDYLPLGSLDRSSLNKARDLLVVLKSLILKLKDKMGSAPMVRRLEVAEEINQKTCEYYELIPSAKYMDRPIQSFTKYNIDESIGIVDDLLNFEISTKILCGAQFRERSMHPFDYCLGSLNIKMATVDLKSEEAQIVVRNITSDDKYNAEIVKRIFAVSRPEEEKSFVKLGNKKMLWHGTKTENLLSILYSGLRSTSLGARTSGSLLGKGIYFSDVFTKSIEYSKNHYLKNSNESVFILFCEVALGKMKKIYTIDRVETLESGFDSIKGRGKTTHLKEQDLYLNNGCLVPLGKVREKNESERNSETSDDSDDSDGSDDSESEDNRDHIRKMGRKIIGEKKEDKKKKKQPYYNYYEYNEFLVKNPKQIKIRYLVEIDYNRIKEIY